jgi:3-methylfumaryl-CoA hydratase
MLEEIAMDHLRTWIGRQDRASDTITPELLKRFRAALGGYTELGSQPPLGMHWCLAMPAVTRDGLGIDGHPAKGPFLPPVPLPRRMWASSRLRFHQPASVGTTIERTSTIADIVFKQSAASGPLVFVAIDHTFTQKSGQGTEALLEERQTIVYRQPSPFKQAAPQEPKHTARSLNILPDSTLLFRYSAVTFNGHRIHYDHNYTTSVEGYPGLVVHGPLMATLLMNLAQSSRPNHPLQEFEFRGVAPAFVDEALVLSVIDEDVEALEVSNQEGALIMTASAQFRDPNER